MAAKTLRVSPDLALPPEAVTHSFGLLAMRGSGKTNAARVLAEEMYDAGLPFVAIDPVGSWYGLRSGRDGGKSGGLAIPILGGRHADLPLHRGAGVRIAQLVVGSNLSCVLDLSDMESEAAKKAFLLDFARELYAKNQTARHIFLEEADDYIPQRPMRDELQLKRAWENIVRRGRSRGLGFTLITQRSACVNKDVLTQVETLFVLRTTGKQDRDALEAWVTHNDTGIARAELRVVPELASGEAFCWSPTLLGKSVRLKFRLSRTFDSGATPKPGEAPRAATLADVDLDAVRAELDELDPGAEDGDDEPTTSRPSGAPQQMAELRNRIAELERELVAAREWTMPEATLSRLENAARTLHETGIAAVEAARDVIGALPTGKQMFTEPPTKVSTRVPVIGVAVDDPRAPELIPPVTPRSPKPPKANGHPARNSFQSRPDGTGSSLPRGEETVLTAIAQHRDGVTREQLSVLTGYRKSTRDLYVQKLRHAGFITGAGLGLQATESGRKALGTGWKPLPTGAKLRAYWLDRLPAGERAVLSVLVQAHPHWLSREKISDATGYRKSTRDLYIQKLRARRLATDAERGGVKASDELF